MRNAELQEISLFDEQETETPSCKKQKMSSPALPLYLTREEVYKKRNFTESNKAAFIYNDWTLLEWRLFIMIVSRLNSIEISGIEEESNRPIEVHIPFSDLYHKLGISRQNARKMIESAMDGLHSKIITFLKRDEDGNLVRDTQERYNFIFSSQIKHEYNKRTGKEHIHLIAKLNGDLNYLFLNLRKEFFSIDSDILFSLENAAAIKLYILFVVAAHKANGTMNRTYKLPHLRLLVGKENKYQQYNGFKQNIIQAAVKEINEKTDMTVSYKEEKDYGSKAVNAITFTFGFPKKEAPVEAKQGNGTYRQTDTDKKCYEQMEAVSATLRDKKLIAICMKQRLKKEQIAKFAVRYGYKNFRYLVWLACAFDPRTFYQSLKNEAMCWDFINQANGEIEVAFD